MVSKQTAELAGWLGGTIVVGLVFGIGFGLLVRPGLGLVAGTAAAAGWFLLGAFRFGWQQRRRRG